MMFIYHKIFVRGDLNNLFNYYNKGVQNKEFKKTEYNDWLKLRGHLLNNDNSIDVIYNRNLRTLTISDAQFHMGRSNIRIDKARIEMDFFDYLAQYVSSSSKWLLSTEELVKDWKPRLRTATPNFDNFSKNKPYLMSTPYFLGFCAVFSPKNEEVLRMAREVDVSLHAFDEDSMPHFLFSLIYHNENPDFIGYKIQITETGNKDLHLEYEIGGAIEVDAVIKIIRGEQHEPEDISKLKTYFYSLTANEFNSFYSTERNNFNELQQQLIDYAISHNHVFSIVYCSNFDTMCINDIEKLSNGGTSTVQIAAVQNATAAPGIFRDIAEKICASQKPVCSIAETADFNQFGAPLHPNAINRTRFVLTTWHFFSFCKEFQDMRGFGGYVKTILKNFDYSNMPMFTFDFQRQDDVFTLKINDGAKCIYYNKSIFYSDSFDKFLAQKSKEAEFDNSILPYYNQIWTSSRITPAFETYKGTIPEEERTWIQRGIMEKALFRVIYSPRLQTVSLSTGGGYSYTAENVTGSINEKHFLSCVAFGLNVFGRADTTDIATSSFYHLGKHTLPIPKDILTQEPQFTLTLLQFIRFAMNAKIPTLSVLAHEVDDALMDFPVPKLPNLTFKFLRKDVYYFVVIFNGNKLILPPTTLFKVEEFDNFYNERVNNTMATIVSNNNTICCDSTSNSNMFAGFTFGPVNSTRIALSPYGLAIWRSEDNKWVSYDKDKNGLYDTTILHFNASNILYQVPVPLSKVKENDVIFHLDHPCFVIGTDIEKNSIDVVDPVNGEYRCILPTKSPFGFDFVTKVINLFDYNSVDNDHPFGDMLPFMMLSQTNGKPLDTNALLAMMMMDGDKDFGDAALMPLMFMNNVGSGNSNQMLPMMLWMMNKKRG